MRQERAWGTKTAALAISVAAHGALLAVAWSLLPLPAARRLEVIEVSVLRIEPPPVSQAGSGSRAGGRRRVEGRAPGRRNRGSVAVAPAPAPPSGPGVAFAIEGGTGRAVAFAGDEARALAGGATLAMIAGVATGTNEVVAGADSTWLRAHQRAIERRIQREMDGTPYPSAARQRGLTGKVRVAFTLQPDGHVRDVRVVRSSGREVLDRCAVETVIEAAPYPRPPVDQEVEVPFEFRLVSM